MAEYGEEDLRLIEETEEQLKSKWVACPKCDGTGLVPTDEGVTYLTRCKACMGSGEISRNSLWNQYRLGDV